jgi:sec-independent protein translocase protein TatA
MSPSIWQIGLIVLLILLLFGAGRLPRVMNDLARGIKSFRKGLSEDEDDSGAKSDQPAQQIDQAQNQADEADKPNQPTEHNENR